MHQVTNRLYLLTEFRLHRHIVRAPTSGQVFLLLREGVVDCERLPVERGRVRRYRGRFGDLIGGGFLRRSVVGHDQGMRGETVTALMGGKSGDGGGDSRRVSQPMTSRSARPQSAAAV